MIDFNVRWIDVTKNLLTMEQPFYYMERPLAHKQAKAWAGTSEVGRLGEFWVPENDLLGDRISWAVTRTGEVVRIPILAYQVSRANAYLWALGMQLGMAAIDDLYKHIRIVEPISVTLVLGHECTDLSPVEEAFRCYAGLAVRVR